MELNDCFYEYKKNSEINDLEIINNKVALYY